MDLVADAVHRAERPVVVCGKGVRLAGAVDAFDRFVRAFAVPVVSTIGGMDTLPEQHPFYFGRFGPTGQRRANFVVQNADLVLCLGSGMSIAAVGFDTSGFAPAATRIMVNVDPGEMTKPHFTPDIGVRCDLLAFLDDVLSMESRPASPAARGRWLAACTEFKERYPLITADYLEDTEHVNSYYLAHALSRELGETDVVITGNSLDAHSVFHSFAVSTGQRVYTNTNYGAMGWDVPALVGACVARPNDRTVLVTGDGSVQFNVQELLTVGSKNMNARIFVLNNGGYQAIRATQRAFCEGRLVGCDDSSGVCNPRFDHLAAAYGLKYTKLTDNAEVDARLSSVLETDGPVLCEVNVGYEQERLPRVKSQQLADGTMRSGALEDQYPFLPPDEVQRNMQISRQARQAGTDRPEPDTE